jgi:hypothetical protein
MRLRGRVRSEASPIYAIRIDTNFPAGRAEGRQRHDQDADNSPCEGESASGRVSEKGEIVLDLTARLGGVRIIL